MLRNSITLCVNCVHNWTIVDEKFELMLEYVEHQLLSKIVMGLKATKKERRAQKMKEYEKKKMQDWEAKATPCME